ncbi:5-(carboxyamino)imidazole ribonucleotide mutase [Methanococcus maripaludis]|uniref:N5-carboxyaminoimidazole ribonucleotide mutase n=3 Tax=Methanococcus maripaludis TaxID=39152 RepID=Q6M0I8_METMP|nr:5-(carboxyamino)imidazole ribonucleotide mutase [Methanococcus maripaludis]AEK19176.1 phosphoribosylaminoimidazole carboxylase, catalytic subunit [Methanococcus maripaludis X1]MBM7410031.1 5-(carboxyamino)imidazole ribonucleotide mutase [Methanococcus maripaludis]MBP2219361.1 5-(carboxyamino)imidazole ribonucleotide mutase [Methanococcus maripaludis]CAF29838.1 Phosphoribosylaminoimidazole carboxylase catalytic subunit [Methanococcus maripaludis S2]
MITIIMGSKSDVKIAEKAVSILKEFKIDYEVRVASAHRTPELVEEIVKNSKSKVFIAIAGLAAHLPGVVAAMTTKPVIAVPVESKLDGLDALLSAVQMPPGIPAACVGIDRGENAAILAAEMLSISDERIEKKLAEFRENQKKKIFSDDAEVSSLFKN